jgi:hypothetical protein
MFFVYGAMLDTMVVAFPLAVGLLCRWMLDWRSERVDPWLPAGLALAAGLAGWQGVFLGLVCGGALLARARRDRAWLLRATPYLLGSLAATALTVAWARWVYGSLDPLHDKLGRRSGDASGVGLGQMAAFQLPWLGQLLGLGLFAWIGTALALRDARFRPVAAVSLVAVVGYALVFREGAGGHQYWNYWGLLPTAIGAAWLFDRAADRALASGRSWTDVAVGASAAVMAVAGVNATLPDDAAALVDEGGTTLALALEPLRQGQALWYVGEEHRPDDWLRYARRPQAGYLATVDQVRDLAAERPDDVVVVLGACPKGTRPDDLCAALNEPGPRRTTAAALSAEVGAP